MLFLLQNRNDMSGEHIVLESVLKHLGIHMSTYSKKYYCAVRGTYPRKTPPCLQSAILKHVQANTTYSKEKQQ